MRNQQVTTRVLRCQISRTPKSGCLCSLAPPGIPLISRIKVAFCHCRCRTGSKPTLEAREASAIRPIDGSTDIGALGRCWSTGQCGPPFIRWRRIATDSALVDDLRRYPLEKIEFMIIDSVSNPTNHQRQKRTVAEKWQTGLLEILERPFRLLVWSRDHLFYSCYCFQQIRIRAEQG